jgi:serine/threonine protein kinase
MSGHAVGGSVGSAVVFSTSDGLQKTYLIKKEEIELQQKLGEGAFGAVYRGRCRGASVAVKMPSKDIEEDQLLEFQQEVITMSSISHPRLAMLLGAHIPLPGSKVDMTSFFFCYFFQICFV